MGWHITDDLIFSHPEDREAVRVWVDNAIQWPSREPPSMPTQCPWEAVCAALALRPVGQHPLNVGLLKAVLTPTVSVTEEEFQHFYTTLRNQPPGPLPAMLLTTLVAWPQANPIQRETVLNQATQDRRVDLVRAALAGGADPNLAYAFAGDPHGQGQSLRLALEAGDRALIECLWPVTDKMGMFDILAHRLASRREPEGTPSRRYTQLADRFAMRLLQDTPRDAAALARVPALQAQAGPEGMPEYARYLQAQGQALGIRAVADRLPIRPRRLPSPRS
jgi:hypothetical protein